MTRTCTGPVLLLFGARLHRARHRDRPASARLRPPPGRAEDDRRVGRPPDAGSRSRPRFTIRDAHEALRPAQPRPRACSRHHHAAWSRRSRRASVRARTATGSSSASPIPNDIRGTGFLVWEHPSSDDERFLYLPSLGRVRRIAGSETQESFVGSDFTYEDIGGREFDDYTYAFSGSDGENASWTPPAGGAPVRPGGSSPAGRMPRPTFRASCRSCSRSLWWSSAPMSTTAATRSRRSTRCGVSSRSNRSGR